MLLTSLIFTLIWHMHFWNRMPRVRHWTPLLKDWRHDRALYVLTGHVNEFSPYWYELALLHFMNEAYMNAATAFRYGFLTSIYCWNALLESSSIPWGCIVWFFRYFWILPNIIAKYSLNYELNIHKHYYLGTGHIIRNVLKCLSMRRCWWRKKMIKYVNLFLNNKIIWF